jgi:hypothetical protein
MKKKVLVAEKPPCVLQPFVTRTSSRSPNEQPVSSPRGSTTLQFWYGKAQVQDVNAGGVSPEL